MIVNNWVFRKILYKDKIVNNWVFRQTLYKDRIAYIFIGLLVLVNLTHNVFNTHACRLASRLSYLKSFST